MKKIVLIALVLFSTMAVQAQDWVTDFSQAKKMAKEENKKIVLVFSGSDWCGPCIKLDKNVWSTSEFKKIEQSKYVMVKADFPRSRKNKLPKEQQAANDQLAEKYNQQGFFPLVVVFDSNGKKLGTLGYEDLAPKDYAKLIDSL